MATLPQIGGTFVTTTQATTGYIPIGNTAMTTATNMILVEAQMQTKYFTAGVLTNLYVRLSTNGVSNTSTVITRKGGVSQNLTLSIAASTAGEFEDIVNSDTVAANDLWNLMVTVGAVGTGPLITVTGTTFTPTSGVMQKHQSICSNTNGAGTNYDVMCGTSSSVTVEANAQNICQQAGTWKNFSINVLTAIAVAFTYQSRINAAAGNMTVSTGISASGRFDDIVNTDTIAVGNLINFKRF